MTVSIPAASTLSGTTNYQYDYGQSVNPALNRSQLTGETSTRSGGYTKTYAYDGGTATGPGNPTSYQGTASTFNSDNQNVGGSLNFAFDGNGNQIYPTAIGHQHLYDPENRLNSYYGGVSTFAYDGDGQQAWDQNGGNPRSYFFFASSQQTYRVGILFAVGLLRKPRPMATPVL